MSSALSSMKSTIARTKQRVMVKAGKSDETYDVEYHNAKEQVNGEAEVLTRVSKQLKKQQELLRDMVALNSTITSVVSDMFSPGDTLYVSGAQAKSACAQIEEHRVRVSDKVDANVQRPLDEYCNQFKEVKKRQDEYSTRRVDMDRYAVDIQKTREKAATAQAKLPMLEEKHAAAKASYEDLRDELLQDLTALHRDRTSFLNYITAGMIKNQMDFYSNAERVQCEVLPLLAAVDESRSLSHPRIITPNERSSATSNVRANPVFIGAGGSASTGPVMHSTSSTPTSTPPTTNYAAAPVAAAPVAAAAAPVSLAKPAPPVSTSQQAQALFDFMGEDENELNFQKGDIITILTSHGEWWEGQLNGRKGLLPSNYVQLM